MKKINVIIPNYNYGKYLELCLLSIFVQRCSCEIEILVADDNSSDQSLGILRRIKNFYDNEKIKLNFFSFEENRGEVQNTCFLLEKCDGDYIAYLDADDFWIDPNKLQKQFEFMEENPEYSLCFTGNLRLTEKEGYIPTPEADFWFGPPNDFNDEEIGNPDFIATRENCITSSSRFFRNYPDLSQRDFFSKFEYSDWALTYELSLRGKVKLMHYPSYVYRIHPGSLSKISKDGAKAVTSPIFEQRKQEFLQQKFNNQ